jgi:hypothetical protein
MGRRGTPVGNRGTPMGRRGTLMGRRGTPMGRRGIPMGRRGTPMGRRVTPMGRRGTFQCKARPSDVLCKVSFESQLLYKASSASVSQVILQLPILVHIVLEVPRLS